MKKKNILVISIAFVVLVLAGIFTLREVVSRQDKTTLNLPAEPTQQEIEAAKALPRDQCSCWDGVDNVCLPQRDCI